MPSVRLPLVARYPRPGNALPTLLGKCLPETVLLPAFASIRDHLGPDTRAMILFGSTSAADSQHGAALLT